MSEITRPTTFNGQSGHWEAVDIQDQTVLNQISSNPDAPSLASDGYYYYKEEVVNEPIAANATNAIPAPPSIVQLPPIVQPIAMVPYTTQNQPLVQYDPNTRPAVQHTEYKPEPVYRKDPQSIFSVLISLFSIIVIAIACILTLYNDNTIITGIKSLFGETGTLANISASTDNIFLTIVPIVYAVIAVICIIILINALVHLVKLKPLHKFNGWSFAALLLAIANIVIMFIKKEIFEKIGIGAYVVAGILLVMFILQLFVNNKKKMLDYVKAKETYVMR
ncbi:MAG: hypothetical protein K5765_03180 [Clostridia bacterium]|nr:hypothetical protein [Clostridia bacterium]